MPPRSAGLGWVVLSRVGSGRVGGGGGGGVCVGREGRRSLCAVVDLKGAIDRVEILIDDVNDDEL